MKSMGYIVLVKPKTVALLVFTSFSSMLVANFKYGRLSIPVAIWILAILAITLGCAGCNATTCYIDRDIDAIMERTMYRPLPTGRIHPPEKALYFGLSSIGISL